MNIIRPKTLNELSVALNRGVSQSLFIAGGTDVLVESRQSYFTPPQTLIDLSYLDDLKGIEENDGFIRIGALATHTEILQNPLIRQYAPLLAEACAQVGSQQIRNRGTLGGNICNASPCADTVPPLLALEAEVEIFGPDKTRRLPMEEFFVKPYRTVLQKNEALTAVYFPPLPAGYGSAFYKLGRRKALAISRINMAAVLKTDDSGLIKEVRLAPGSVFPVWKRVSAAENFLLGKKAGEENFQKAGEITAQEMIKISGRRWSTPYKEPVVAALVKRVLLMAAGQNEE